MDRRRSTRVLGSLALLAISAMAAGCGEGSPSAGGASLQVVDSAGIEVVRFDRSEAPVAWRVAPEPEWVLGDGDGGSGVLLHQVGGVLGLPDGWVAVSEASTRQILLVDPEGEDLIRLGGAGDGPEEFGSAPAMFRVGAGGEHRIGVHDRWRGRYVEIAMDGSWLHQVELPEVAGPPAPPRLLLPPGSPHSGEGGPEGFLIVDPAMPAELTTAPVRGTGTILRLRGGVAEPLTTFLGPETVRTEALTGSPIYGARSHLGMSEEGLWIGDSAEPEVVLWAEGPAPARIVRWTGVGDRTVTDARVEEFWSRLEAGLPEGQRDLLEGVRAAIPMSQQMPAFGALAAGPGGALWIRDELPPEGIMLEAPPPAHEWLVVDFTAGYAERVLVPPGLVLHEIGDEVVLGVHTDEMGVQTVRLHRLERIPDPLN
ncbi:MAG: hypothetical protein WD960_01135 [Gemmatimonadota bacterium]